MPPQPSFDIVSDIQQILEFPFMQNALAAGTLVAILSGVVGWFVVLRGQSFAAHTLSQVGFPGAALAALVGVAPLFGLIAFCAAAALAIAARSRGPAREPRTETAFIGIVLAFALALGFLVAHLSTGFVGSIYAFLFGSFLGISVGEVALLLGLTSALLMVMALGGRPLLFASVDPAVAAARGVPVRLLGLGFLVVVGFTAAGCALITGTTLVFALLVAPAAIAQRITLRPWLGIALAVVIAVAITWLSLSVAYFTIYPIGFFLTTIALVVFVIVILAQQVGRRLAVRLAAT